MVLIIVQQFVYFGLLFSIICFERFCLNTLQWVNKNHFVQSLWISIAFLVDAIRLKPVLIFFLRFCKLQFDDQESSELSRFFVFQCNDELSFLWEQSWVQIKNVVCLFHNLHKCEEWNNDFQSGMARWICFVAWKIHNIVFEYSTRLMPGIDLIFVLNIKKQLSIHYEVWKK